MGNGLTEVHKNANQTFHKHKQLDSSLQCKVVCKSSSSITERERETERDRDRERQRETETERDRERQSQMKFLKLIVKNILYSGWTV